MRTMASALLYEQAARLGVSEAEIEVLRASLKVAVASTATDRPLTPYGTDVRILACQVLLKTPLGKWDWRGWYTQRLHDPTLAGDALLGPLESDPEPLDAGFHSSSSGPDGNVRASAAHLLAMLCVRQHPRKDAMLALLPWFENPAWVRDLPDNYRYWAMLALAEIDLPEAVPVLIRILQKDPRYGRPVGLALIRNSVSACVAGVARRALQQ